MISDSARRTLLVIVILLGCMSAPARAQPQFANEDQEFQRLVALLDRRLALMPEVAAFKWQAGQPIVDAVREQAVIERSMADAESIGVDGESSRRFFDVQIRMARAVQADSFKRWRAATNPSVPIARDLSAELRPLLDTIGVELLQAVHVISAELPRLAAAAPLDTLRRHSGMSDELLSELRAALAALRPSATPTWATIKRAGVLRVGATGDYAPFNVERDGTLTGFDVELAEALAHHLGVEVRFVRTSWPTLMADFKARRFDIALSGISVTAERSALADFSVAYHTDGKLPIARCVDARRFATLEQIDQPTVRLIVNPGGTNERFVRERIKRARVVVHADNRTIFDEIAAGRADVMLTDGVEVELQTRRHPGLCGTMREPLTRADKAIMLPRASELTTQVNAWLAPQIASGQIKEQLQRAVTGAR